MSKIVSLQEYIGALQELSRRKQQASQPIQSDPCTIAKKEEERIRWAEQGFGSQVLFPGLNS